MGQWRLQILMVPGIGVYFTCTKQEITIALPFVQIYIGLTKHASGWSIFGRYKY